MKQCCKCRETKPLTDFHKKTMSKDGHQHYCKICLNKQRMDWIAAHPERVAELRLQKKLRAKYGITLAEYATLLARACCDICGATEAGGRWNTFSVDHCHAGGHVRGLLCDRCNRALGFFNDDPELLRRAATYLEQNAVQPPVDAVP